MDFGTGCLKVTPAHDMNDKLLAEKHNLEFIDIFNSDATLNERGLSYKGLDRFVARKKIVEELKISGILVNIELHNHKIGTSERTKVIIEPRLSDQWFLKTSKISQPAIDAVLKTGDIQLLPEKFNNTYSHWLENIRDWNISRQLWWGQRIPAYYYGPNKDDFVVAVSEDEALRKAKKATNNDDLTLFDLNQDKDVLDTWFSSWLWPISVFDGIRNPNNDEIKYYYPTQDLVTGPDILFFWVARMIMSGYEYRKQPPFTKVYLTGLVRDKKGRKMSKQLGNSPDAIKLIEDYGADAVRVGLMLSSAAGNDLLFDEILCKQGKNFANKIWNAYRLIESWDVNYKKEPSLSSKEALEWYENHFQKTLDWVNKNFEKYRISDALMSIYKLVWDDFCSWLLELIKPEYGQSIDSETYFKSITLFENNLRLLHPFMPFLTEEIWHFISDRKKDEALIISSWPKLESFDSKIEEDFNLTKNIIIGIRNFRKEKNISFKEKIDLCVTNGNTTLPFQSCIKKLGSINSISFGSIPNKEKGGSFRVGILELFIPTQISNDPKSEKEKLNNELVYLRGFLTSVEKKLSNKGFINKAPKKIITMEIKKLEDTKEKIILLEKSLAEL